MKEHLLGPLWNRLALDTALDSADRSAFLALPFHARRCEAGDHLEYPGKARSEYKVLVSGFAYRGRLLSDGSRQIVSVHVPSEFVNLDLLIEPTAPHDLRMLTPGRIASVDARAFEDCVRSRPAVLRALWRQTTVEASIFSEWIARLGRRDARARVAHFLCEFALRARLVCGKNIALPMTQVQLADATGLSPVHVNRTLAGLRRSGLIRVALGDIHIRNLAGLAEAGDFDPSYLGLALGDEERGVAASRN